MSPNNISEGQHGPSVAELENMVGLDELSGEDIQTLADLLIREVGELAEVCNAWNSVKEGKLVNSTFFPMILDGSSRVARIRNVLSLNGIHDLRAILNKEGE